MTVQGMGMQQHSQSPQSMQGIEAPAPLMAGFWLDVDVGRSWDVGTMFVMVLVVVCSVGNLMFISSGMRGLGRVGLSRTRAVLGCSEYVCTMDGRLDDVVELLSADLGVCRWVNYGWVWS